MTITEIGSKLPILEDGMKSKMEGHSRFEGLFDVLNIILLCVFGGILLVLLDKVSALDPVVNVDIRLTYMQFLFEFVASGIFLAGFYLATKWILAYLHQLLEGQFKIYEQNKRLEAKFNRLAKAQGVEFSDLNE